MRRREFITLVGGGAAAWPKLARAQQRLSIVGLLLPGNAVTGSPYVEAFRGAMRELAYVEGNNVRFEYRFADGNLDRLPELAADLARLNPSVIVSATLPAHLAARGATSTTPIVMAAGGDPAAFGLVKSLSHPGGNVTGLATFAELLASKQIDVLRELMPHLSRLAVLVDVADPVHVPQLRETMAAATANGITLVPIELASIDELATAFSVLSEKRVEALSVPPDPLFFNFRRRIAELAAKMGLPAIYSIREHVEDGGLISYGPDNRDSFRRAAAFVDKILKGAKPADLPVEQPIKFELLINLKTAKALGLTVPSSLLGRADEVIE